jgi:hypothetical protein
VTVEVPGVSAPAVTVVTASRDRHDTLMRKAEALARQPDPATFEWRLYLNEPSASVEAFAARLATLAPAFAVEIDGGRALPVGAARNRAAAAARGRIVLFSDDDCMPDPGAITAHVAFHERVRDAAGIGALRLPEHLRVGSRREPFERTARFIQGRASWINFTGANSSLPTAAFRAVGGYDAAWAGYGGEDPELALRLRSLGLRFRHVPGGAAVHEGRVSDDVDKAYSAGSAHVRVVRRHPGHGAAWLLGVHPVLVALKRAWLRSPGGRLLDPAVRAYERAYADGAAAGWRDADA